MCLLLKNRRVILLVLIVALSVSASSQSNQTFVTTASDALGQVPSEKRGRLSERLESYIQRFNAYDLDSIYELMPASCTRGLTKENWLKQVHVKSPGRILRFDVAEVYAGDYTLVANVNGEKWIARGCGTYQQGKKTVRYQASIQLVLVDAEWYICGSGVASEVKDDKPIKCSDGT
jgi:hypothetical protein